MSRRASFYRLRLWRRLLDLRLDVLGLAATYRLLRNPLPALSALHTRADAQYVRSRRPKLGRVHTLPSDAPTLSHFDPRLSRVAVCSQMWLGQPLDGSSSNTRSAACGYARRAPRERSCAARSCASAAATTRSSSRRSSIGAPARTRARYHAATQHALRRSSRHTRSSSASRPRAVSHARRTTRRPSRRHLQTRRGTAGRTRTAGTARSATGLHGRVRPSCSSHGGQQSTTRSPSLCTGSGGAPAATFHASACMHTARRRRRPLHARLRWRENALRRKRRGYEGSATVPSAPSAPPRAERVQRLDEDMPSAFTVVFYSFQRTCDARVSPAHAPCGV